MTFKGPFIDSNGNLIDGSGVSIAILDTGIDLDHPFFGPDDDNNSIADKIADQYDFGGNVLGGSNDSQAIDTDGHGTHVASIAASSDINYPGVAPGAKLLALKVFPDGNNVSGSFADIEEALQWVLAHKDTYNIVAVNLSLGDNSRHTSVDNSSISNEFLELAQNDITVVSAAGNGGGVGISYPAADAYSLAVSAVDNQGKIAGFSQHHSQLTDVFAPGVNIQAARNNGGSISLSGTSMATPHVSGAIAIAQQLALQELNRRLTFDEIKTLLKQGDYVTNKLEYGKKLLNVSKLGDAILQMSPYDPTTHLTLLINGFSESKRVLSYGGEAQDVVSEMTINDTEKELKVEQNTWKKFELGDYIITNNTVLEFEFSSSQQGEVHGIGFDNDNLLAPSDTSHFFQLYGSQDWGEQIGNYTEGKVSYSINVGDFFTGSFNYLVLANDDDENASANSTFSNIKLYEQPQKSNEQSQELQITIAGNSALYTIQSYAQGEQDIDSYITVDETQTELKLENNTWKKFEIGNYIITEDTVLEFEFSSGRQGEIHGIGFENDDSLIPSDASHFFKVYGTQEWGIESFDNYSPGATTTYTINVGEFFTGTFNSLVLANDDDATASAESIFRNIKLYEKPEVIEGQPQESNEQPQELQITIQRNLALYTIQSYAQGEQDIDSYITVDETQNELKLENNTWKKFEIGDYIITEDTVLEFEFSSGRQGEIHGIGFENDDNLIPSDASHFFKVYGTQEWGIDSFDNYSPGATTTYTINVGEFFTGTFNSLVLANDDDATASAESIFSNIKLYENTEAVYQNETIDPLIGSQSLDVFTLEDVTSGISNDHENNNELLIPQSDINQGLINVEKNIEDDFFSSGTGNLLSETTVLSTVNQNDDLLTPIPDNSDNNIDYSILLS